MQHLTQLRPLREFTQIPNAALDGLPDLNSIGLLTIVLRHTESWHFTVDQLIAEKKAIPGPKLGRDTAYKAMRTLVAHRWIAKIVWRDEGGHFHTAVFRTVVAFTDDDYVEMCSRYVEGTQMWVECGGCDEDEPVLTRVKGTPNIECALGKKPITQVMFPQVATGPGIPEAGEPSAGRPSAGQPASGEATAFKKTRKNTNKKREGEGDARGRVNAAPVDNPTEWGIAPQAWQVPGGTTLFSRAVIDDVAAETGLGLSPDHHRRLVTELMPVALDAVARLGDENISGAELAAWLKTRHQTTESLYAVLAARLRPDYLTEHLPAWVARQGARTPSPQPQADRPSREPSAAPGPQRKGRRCPTHKTWMLPDASGHGWTCVGCEAEEPPARPTPAPPVPVPWQSMPEPDSPEHCGRCHADHRHLITFDDLRQEHVDLGPCPDCHPTPDQCPRCRETAAHGAA